MLRKSLVSSFLALGLTFAPAIAAAGEGAECTQGKLSLQAVVDKHLKAVGGKERLKAVKSFQLTTIAKEGDTVTTINMQRARPNLVRYDMDKNGTKVTKVFDGQQGWMAEGTAAPQRLDKEKNAMMAEGAAFDDALLDPKARGVTLAMDGVEEVNGASAFKLVLTRGATTEVRFIDQTSFLEVRRTYAGTHEGKAYNKAVTFSDYRNVDGIMVSHRVQWAADGKQGEKVIQSARYDAPIDAAVFKPATPRS
ncbi:outer membrane lipoprotein-sorting protein [Pyxidicoccus trucidator]|uniref:outer membrane lipoprotein-sorting protein n=1 Tax=Pyxidicoccus trucidator TaxID=2709662 RepID=UPI0013D9B6E0|nr:outer membrane lipoprotein-sorting protein [Pyxidicoccus trucidator]